MGMSGEAIGDGRWASVKWCKLEFVTQRLFRSGLWKVADTGSAGFQPATGGQDGRAPRGKWCKLAILGKQFIRLQRANLNYFNFFKFGPSPSVEFGHGHMLHE